MPQDETPKVTMRETNWAAIVKQSWGEEWNKRDYVYHFSNDRKFYEPLQQDINYSLGG